MTATAMTTIAIIAIIMFTSTYADHRNEHRVEVSFNSNM